MSKDYAFRMALTREFVDEPPRPWSESDILENLRFAMRCAAAASDRHAAFNGALDALRDLGRQTQTTEVVVSIRADGRVELAGIDRHGCDLWRVRADLDRDSSDPLPSAALLQRFPGGKI